MDFSVLLFSFSFNNAFFFYSDENDGYFLSTFNSLVFFSSKLNSSSRAHLKRRSSPSFGEILKVAEEYLATNT